MPKNHSKWGIFVDLLQSEESSSSLAAMSYGVKKTTDLFFKLNLWDWVQNLSSSDGRYSTLKFLQNQEFLWEPSIWGRAGFQFPDRYSSDGRVSFQGKPSKLGIFLNFLQTKEPWIFQSNQDSSDSKIWFLYQTLQSGEFLIKNCNLRKDSWSQGISDFSDCRIQMPKNHTKWGFFDDFLQSEESSSNLVAMSYGLRKRLILFSS